jgi:hypothetical protein
MAQEEGNALRGVNINVVTVVYDFLVCVEFVLVLKKLCFCRLLKKVKMGKHRWAELYLGERLWKCHGTRAVYRLCFSRFNAANFNTYTLLYSVISIVFVLVVSMPPANLTHV